MVKLWPSHRIPLVVIIFVSATLALACSGSSKGAGGSQAGGAAESLTVDNCSLVTDEEASKLAGHTLKHDEDSVLGCPFVRPGSSLGEFGVRAFNGKGPAKDNFGSHSEDTTVHEIPGVGDSAAVLAREDHVNFLIVQKGPHYVQFVTTFLKNVTLNSEDLKQAENLALTALSRIK